MIFFIKKYCFVFNFLLVASIHNIAATSEPNVQKSLDLTQSSSQRKKFPPKYNSPESDRPILNHILATSNTPEELLAQLKKYNFTQEEINNSCLLIETIHKLTAEIMNQLPKN